MNSSQLRDIVEKIMTGEVMDLKKLCAEAGVSRSYLSKTINLEVPVEIRPGKMLNKLIDRFPSYFKGQIQERHESDTESTLKDELLESYRAQAELQKEIARLRDQVKELAELQAIVAEYKKKVSSAEKSANTAGSKSNPYERSVEQLSKGLNPEYTKEEQSRPVTPSKKILKRKRSTEE